MIDEKGEGWREGHRGGRKERKDGKGERGMAVDEGEERCCSIAFVL